MNFSGFETGVNLGGWLSQYSRENGLHPLSHFDAFIQEKDIQQIASWGCDHVRLPIDYPLIELDEQPGVYLEDGFAYIDQCVQWCQKAGINLIIDLHHAPGYSFTTLAENSLFHDQNLQLRLSNLWMAIVRRYAGVHSINLCFELLNEVVLPESALWNALASRLIADIRKIDSEHMIMIGSNLYGAARTLHELDHFSDPKIAYTFHFYEPMPFTHQKAGWVEWLKDYPPDINYPGETPELEKYVKAHPRYAPQLQDYIGKTYNSQLLEEYLQPAFDFLQTVQAPLYCGEYGVIDLAPIESNIRWNRDLVALLKQHHIARAYWSYKQMDFGLVDQNGNVLYPELVRAVCQH